MSKEEFIKNVEEAIKKNPELFSNDSIEFFEVFKSGKLDAEKKKSMFTEKGKEILIYIQEHYQDFNNTFSSKQIGESMNMPAKSVSGSMRSLVANGFIEKINDKPVVYSLTEKGKAIKVDAE